LHSTVGGLTQLMYILTARKRNHARIRVSSERRKPVVFVQPAGGKVLPGEKYREKERERQREARRQRREETLYERRIGGEPVFREE